MGVFPTCALCMITLVLGASLVSAELGSDGLSNNPIRKIVTLLQDMQREVEAEGNRDKELYEKFMCFCDNGVGGLQKTIAEAKAQIEDNTAKIEEEKSEKAQLEQDLEMHHSDREQATNDLQKAQGIRNKETTTFDAEYADAKSNLEALNKAVPALEAGIASGSSSLVQLPGDESAQLQKVISSAHSITSRERRSALAFLSGKISDESASSGEILGILKQMTDEMKEDKEKLEQAEAVNGKGFEELKHAKDQEVKLATQAIEQKQKRIGELGVSVAQRNGNVEDSGDEQADAEKMITTLDRECATKKDDYDARQKTRAEEVAAISETIGVLNDDDALEVFKKAVPSASSLVQQDSFGKARKLGFLQGHSMNQITRLQKASDILATVGGFYKSSQLQLVAYSAKASFRDMVRQARHGKNGGAVDFSEIIRSIDEMMAVLTSESTDDEKHKEWCRGEFNKAEDETKARQDQVSALTAGMEEMSDQVAQWTEDLKTLEESIQATDKEVAQATEQRKEEHAAYLTSVQLSQAAGALLKKATNRLLKFYNPSLYMPPPKEELSPEDRIAANMGGDPSFIQKHTARSVVTLQDAPALLEGTAAPNKKSGGVLQLMDMLAHELEMDRQQVEHEEKSAQQEYVELMSESQAARETDSKSVVDKTEAKANLEAKITDAKENKMNTHKSLEIANAYGQELHGACDFIIENFDVRKEARRNELEGLRNAKAALAGATFF